MPEEQQKTGEEDEHVVFASEGTLFQFDEQDTKMWRERGRGELRVNKAHSGVHTPPAAYDNVDFARLLCSSSLVQNNPNPIKPSSITAPYCAMQHGLTDSK